MKVNSILITGAAGDIGRGMSKILRKIPWVKNVYGVDINDQFPTEHFYDGFIKGLKISDEDYLTSIENIVKKYDIEIIIPASEAEIRYFNMNRINSIGHVPILLASFNIMDIGFDKLKTVNFLKDSKLPFPWTIKVENGVDIETPCIIKSRNGSGSKDVSIVTDRNKAFFDNTYIDYIFQELLLPDTEEYTCGVFRSSQGVTKMIIFRRVLHGGRTGYGEVVENHSIEALVDEISNILKFQGSINIQLRLKEKTPLIFEINPRFSSTLVFRNELGFKDLEWSIKDRLNRLDNIEFDCAKVIGKKIFRSEHEIVY